MPERARSVLATTVVIPSLRPCAELLHQRR
jgi:hypothetical protein